MTATQKLAHKRLTLLQLAEKQSKAMTVATVYVCQSP